MRTLLLTFAGVLLLNAVGSAALIDTATMGAPRNDFPSNLGYEFTYTGSQPLQVTALGVYNGNPSGGLVGSYPVTLYDFTLQTALTTVTISAGSGSPSSFVYSSSLSASVQLQPGTKYVLAAFYASNGGTTDDPFFNVSAISGDIPASGFVARYSSTQTNVFPNTQTPSLKAYGPPNLQGELVPTPEPSGIVLLSAGLIGFALKRRRRG